MFVRVRGPGRLPCRGNGPTSGVSVVFILAVQSVTVTDGCVSVAGAGTDLHRMQFLGFQVGARAVCNDEDPGF